MANGSSEIPVWLLGCFFLLVVNSVAIQDSVSFNRSSFPAGFIFGTASSAYQYEGAAKEGGRGPSIWDVFTQRYPGKIKDHSNGVVADDSYHRENDNSWMWESVRFQKDWTHERLGRRGSELKNEDVGIMKEMGLDAYRFSISWSRLLPHGKLSGGVNEEGIMHYNNLINELISNGIQPFVTLFHWDLPQTLEEDYGGFLSPHIIEDFRDYAELCYREFGDRVKHWITLNEPWSFSIGGYDMGIHAPGRCSKWIGNCSSGNSATEPYLVAHHQLLAHAAAVKVYKDTYQASQKGKIGITVVSHWMVPFSKDVSNYVAAQRALDFMFGWFMQPLSFGHYPKSMQSLLGNRLPRFKKEQSAMVKGSFDFLGLNYYTANYAANSPYSNSVNQSYFTDFHTALMGVRHGVAIGPKAGSDWLYMYPRGIWELLLLTKKRYNNPTIYITENGVSEVNNSTLTLEEALKDNLRIEYHRLHLLYIRRAIEEGVDVRGYFAWSLLDNFEWGDGYTVRFGINYVDYKDGQKRYPKHSAIWFTSFLKR